MFYKDLVGLCTITKHVNTPKVPVSQDVCIFCFMRFQIAPAHLSLQPQRRSFRSNCPAQRPTSAAVAQRVHEDDQGTSPSWSTQAPPRQSRGGWLDNASEGDLNQYRFQSYDTSQEGPLKELGSALGYGAQRKVPRPGGWAKASTSIDLTPEEQALRESLQKDSVKPPSLHQDPAQQIQTAEQSSQSNHKRRNQEGFPRRRLDSQATLTDWNCPKCRYLNIPTHLKYRECNATRPGQENVRADWMCNSCENLNAGTCGQCWSCHAQKIPGPEEDESSRVRGWHHVRRPERMGKRQATLEAQLVQREKPTAPETAARDTAAVTKRERLARLEQTKNGGYVGLAGQHKSRGTEGSNSLRPEQNPEQKPAPMLKDRESIKADLDFLEDSTREQAAPRAVPQRLDHVSRYQPASHVSSEGKSHYEPQRLARRYEETANLLPRERRDRAQRRSQRSHTDLDDLDVDDYERLARKLERKEQKKKAKAARKAVAPPTPIILPEFISVSNLAAVLRVRTEDFNAKMKELGFEETNHDHIIDAETAGLIAAEFNFEPIIERGGDRDLRPFPPAKDKSILRTRPPVVTIMGHVDHGKTTLLDYLRKSSVAASEHGGITQHIGAFSVKMPGGRLVTFLDTPGHEAFLSMRQRGANVTDIVILVVAADDSVKPQTIEAIKHAQAAKVPMIVAINKIDKEESNVERVKQDLARYSVELEDYGGDTQAVCVSGKTGQGMEELEDAAIALADILDMRAEVDGQVEGWVLEATTKKAGRVATVLVRRGTLRPGDVIVAGTAWARVRSLRNEAGAMVPFATPGTPVEIDGWRESPSAGDEVIQAPDEQKAKSVIDYRLEASEREKMATDVAAVNEARRLEQERRQQLEKAAELAKANSIDAPVDTETSITSAAPTFQEVFFIIKGDVSGSVEAVTGSVSALGNSEVRPHILRFGVGPVSEFDIDHAAVAKGHIINFNTAVENRMSQHAEARGVDIMDHSIIYKLVDDVKAKLSERLPPTVTQKVIGEAEIGQVFDIKVKGKSTLQVAGCRIRNGVIARNARIRVLRDKNIIYDGMLQTALYR